MDWPQDWYDQRAGVGCPMCDQGRPDTSPSGNRRFYAGRWSDAYLVRRAAQRGSAIVIWRGRHVADPTELSETEAIGYWLEALRVAKAMETFYSAIKLNFELLGNGVPHLHTHITCRFADDVAAHAPLEWSFRNNELDPADIEREVEALSIRLADHTDRDDNSSSST